VKLRPLFAAVPLALVALSCSVGGCEAIVTDPAFACVGNDPSSCPPDQYCSGSKCIPCPDSGCVSVVGGGGSDAGGPASEAGVQLDAPSGACGGALGCTCATATECTSHICGDTSVLSSLVSARSTECTKPCCTSADCPSSFVCFGAGTGGNYCVRAATLGRATLGSSAPGTSCSGASDCRSGSCSNGHCVDTCCSDASCAPPTNCALTAGIDGHTSFVCVQHFGSAPRASCSTGTSCASGVCAYQTCRPRCCGRASAMTQGFHTCTYGSVSNDVYPFADYPTTAPPGVDFGQSCTRDSECRTQLCNAQAGACTDVCCVDGDCASYGAGLVCRPALSGHLVCVKGP
jgi:hypothetical protein